MEQFPKFIIEGENLILMKVSYHREIVSDKEKVKGGGWYRYDSNTNTFTFYGDSYDFGAAKMEDIKKCIENKNVFSNKYFTRNISDKHNFSYDIGSEVVPLSFLQ